MSEVIASTGRRRFVLKVALGALVSPFAALAGRTAEAAEKPKLDPESERARSLAYTHDAASTDNAARKADARCANCAHFKGGDDAQWAPCNVFPEHLVSADGWCKSWFSAG